MITTLTFNNMSNNTQHPYSVPAHYQGTTQEEFQGGKAKVLELFNTLELEDFLNQLIKQILPLESAKWFVLDCAKFVLPVFEQQYPNDKKVKKCIELSESFLNGTGCLNKLVGACNTVYSDFCDTDFDLAYFIAAAAYDAAVNAAADACHVAAYAYRVLINEMQGFVKNWIDQYFNTK